jgi:hypothetical protein
MDSRSPEITLLGQDVENDKLEVAANTRQTIRVMTLTLHIHFHYGVHLGAHSNIMDRSGPDLCTPCQSI